MKPTSVKLPLLRALAGQWCANCGQPVGAAVVSIEAWEQLGSPGFAPESLPQRCPLCREPLKLNPDPPGETA